MFPGFHALDGLFGMHLSGCTQYGCANSGLGQPFCKVGTCMGNSVLLGDFLGWLQASANHGDTFDSVNFSDAVQVFLAKCSCACQNYFHVGLRLEGVFENQVPDCSIRSRYMIKAMQLFDIAIERAAHDQPHNELDTF